MSSTFTEPCVVASSKVTPGMGSHPLLMATAAGVESSSDTTTEMGATAWPKHSAASVTSSLSSISSA